MILRRLGMSCVLLTLALLLGGCGGEDSVACSSCRPAEIGMFPDTADKLVQNYQTCYEAMDFFTLRRILHSQSVMQLQASTVAVYPELGAELDRDEELHIHERMFSRQDQIGPGGETVPALQSLVFQVFSRQGAWQTTPAWEPIPNAEYALYDVSILLDRGTVPALKVQGALRFYVTARDSTINGVTKPYYQLRGLKDLTEDTGPGKATATISWGRAKGLWR